VRAVFFRLNAIANQWRTNLKYLTRLIPLSAFSLVALTGCDNEFKLGADGDVVSYNFQHGAQNWTAGFADYPSNDAATYELASGLRNLPTGFQGSGFMLSGHNRSDDLFMFIKRKISGLSPSSKYKAQLKVTFLSNAGAGCMGIGGAPGESVWLKFGYADKEPKQDGFTLNVPKGDQSQDGTQAKVQGDVAIADAKCDGSVYKAKTLKNSEKTLDITTTADGSVWLFVGTDSGFEGKTTLYYQNIEVRFTPK